MPPLAIPKQIHSAVWMPAAGLPPTVAATCTNTGATMNAATARSSSMIANTRCSALLRSEKPAIKSAGATEPPTPALEVWMSGEAPAWYSPPLLDRIRDSSKATVLTEPLACDAGGQYGGPRDGDSAAPVADRQAGTVR